MDQHHPTGPFLSLKWKALVLTSLVLVALTGSFAALNYLELRKQFERRREDLQNQYALQVQALLDQSTIRLQQLNTAVASLPDIESILQKDREKDATTAFAPLASTLQWDLGIESLALISATGERIAAHGLNSNPRFADMLSAAVKEVIKTETPRSLIDCSDTCLQYAIAPILGKDGNLGALLLGLSLADVVMDFRRVSGTDLGLIVEQVSADPATKEPDRWLSGWQASVVALTNYHDNIRILRSLSDAGVTINRLVKPAYVNVQERDMEVRVFPPLTGFDQRENAHLVVIADITEPMSRIHTATQRSLYLGAVGLLLSELLLLAILWPPTSRLKRAAAILPLLAEGTFSTARAEISGTRPTRMFRDEVDVLNDTAIALSHQLEALNTEVATRTRDLSERMLEITREKNFVTHVLETAQAVILTQDKNNEILMINPYGQALTGYTKSELEGRPFLALLARGSIVTGVRELLTELVSGAREHFEVECDLRCKDDSVVNIVWHHSRLLGPTTDSPLILSVGMDITARKKAELRLAWMADHDPLTGLFNRRRFEQELDQAVASAKRYQHSGALLFFDLDQFKYVNDTSGHSAGDQLLVSLGESLPSLLRETDVIGRLGGDEFGVILTRATADEAIQVAKKILVHVRDAEFCVGERVHKVSASLGIALFPEHGNDVQDLLARADLAMYQVKESGRGGWYLLSDDDQSQRLMHERVLWKQRVERALTDNRFILYVQPIVRIADRSPSHYEVLLRMQGDDGAIIGPTHFIEVAERSGLINMLDRMVMSETIHYQALARDRGLKLTLTVNLSAHAFNDPELLNHLKRLLRETQLDPQQLIFEMTETAALADLTAARRLMEAINEIGCHFALDDFGTGFSSFYYLRQLPFEFIKIDGAFIRNLGDRPDDQVLVKAMGEIARAFKKKTIAEQVEDAETLAVLGQYGIDFAQGYFTGSPVLITEMFGHDVAATEAHQSGHITNTLGGGA